MNVFFQKDKFIIVKMKHKLEAAPTETLVLNDSSKKRKIQDKNSPKVIGSGKSPGILKKSALKSNVRKSSVSFGEEDTNGQEASKTSPSKPNLKKNKGSFKPHKGEPKEPEELDKKQLRKNQKLLKLKRREKERGYAVPDAAKKMFEEMRCKKCSSERRTELANDLYKLLSGKITSAVRSHDLTRMVQWLIKVGPPEVKQNIIDEVIFDSVKLSKTKYSNHIVLRIMNDSDKETRKRVLNNFIGNVAAMMKNRFSAPVVEEYYLKYAKSKDKAYMRQELYSDLFRGSKNPALKSLSDVLSQNPTLTSAILKSTKTMLLKLVDKKSSLGTNLVCDVLYDYLLHCEEQDKLDISEILKSNISVLVKCKSGSKVLMHLLWESPAKVKKLIVKELKTQVLKIAKNNSYLFLLSLFDSVDDTVLIKKAILPVILDNCEELIKNTFGRRVILYLVAHRDSAFFHPAELQLLSKADESANSKKDITLKEKELREPCIENLLPKIKTNPEFWFSEANIAIVTLAILKKGSDVNLPEVYCSISQYLTQNMSDSNSKMIEDAGTHKVLNKLIKEDPVSSETDKFSVCFANCLSIELVENLINSNRGCFLLVNLIESKVDSVLSKIKSLFKKGKLIPKLENQDSKGAELLKKFILQK